MALGGVVLDLTKLQTIVASHLSTGKDKSGAALLRSALRYSICL